VPPQCVLDALVGDLPIPLADDDVDRGSTADELRQRDHNDQVTEAGADARFLEHLPSRSSTPASFNWYSWWEIIPPGARCRYSRSSYSHVTPIWNPSRFAHGGEALGRGVQQRLVDVHLVAEFAEVGRDV
jgi:hypothetical protein